MSCRARVRAPRSLSSARQQKPAAAPVAAAAPGKWCPGRKPKGCAGLSRPTVSSSNDAIQGVRLQSPVTSRHVINRHFSHKGTCMAGYTH